MPLYEFKCQNCGQDFEKIVSFADADKLPTCPACGKTDTRKKISAGAVIGASSGRSSSSSLPAAAPRFT